MKSSLKKSYEQNKKGIQHMNTLQNPRSASERVDRKYFVQGNAGHIQEESSPTFRGIPEATHSDEEEEYSMREETGE